MTYAFDAVLFDLDGTLVETAPEIADAVNDALCHFGLPQVTQMQVNDWIGHGTRTLLVQALACVRHTSVEAVQASADLAEIVAVFDTHYQQRCGTRSQLYPQVRETLVVLRARGVKTAVVTNKEGRYTTTVLNAHQLMPLLDCVVSGDTLPNKKPNPAGIAHCLEQLGVPVARALFVGDSSIDVATARNAGMAVWALPYGYNMGQPIEACAPDRVIADCSALLNS
jgi:phosphoglycolate phosphatase